MTSSERGTVVIVVALHAEIRNLTNAYQHVTTENDGPWTEYRFCMGSMPVVIIHGGVGSVSCVAATEHAIGKYHPTHVLNYGSAGAQVRDIRPGDVIIGEKAVAYSTLQILPGGEELFIPRRFSVNDEIQLITESIVTCSPELVSIAQEQAINWTPERWPIRSSLSYQPDRPPMIRTGVVISADVWNQSIERIDQLRQRHDSLVADMEAASIGQVATLHGLPFLVIKDVSNTEFFLPASVSRGQVELAGDEIGKRAAVLVERVLETLAETG